MRHATGLPRASCFHALTLAIGLLSCQRPVPGAVDGRLVDAVQLGEAGDRSGLPLVEDAVLDLGADLERVADRPTGLGAVLAGHGQALPGPLAVQVTLELGDCGQHVEV